MDLNVIWKYCIIISSVDLIMNTFEGKVFRQITFGQYPFGWIESGKCP